MTHGAPYMVNSSPGSGINLAFIELHIVLEVLAFCQTEIILVKIMALDVISIIIN